MSVPQYRGKSRKGKFRKNLSERARAALAALAFAALAPSAWAGDGIPPPDLVAELSAWVAGELGIEAEVPPPLIRLVARERLPEIASELSGRPITGRDFLALYLPGSHEIVLSEGWDAGSMRDHSVLVHELVHHADEVSGHVPACAAESEARAYRTQEAWLAARGDSLEAAFGIDAFTLLVLTSCGY